MADAQYGEGRQFNLHSAGTDLVEGSALAVKSASGAITVDGVTVGSVNALYVAALGDVAHDAVDAGNPVKIGGLANSAQPTPVAAGDRVNAWFGTSGQQVSAIISDTTGGSDAIAMALLNGPNGLVTRALPTSNFAFNGSNWDRVRTAPGVTGFLGVGGPTASDAVLAVAPQTIGGRASNAAPTAVSADGDVVDARFTRTGALNVYMVDQAGAAASLGGGTQYVGDAAATSTPTGTINMGLANASAPTAVSANNDAVAAWFTTNGIQNVRLVDATGAAIDGSGASGLSVLGMVAADAALTAAPVTIGARASTATPTAMSADGDVVNVWATRTGALVVDGGIAPDAAIAGSPVRIGGRASNAAPTAMSADGDVVDARFTRTGALNVYMVDQAGAAASLGGGTQYVGDAAATSTPTGTMNMGLANASAPTAVSANNDAVAAWFLTNGIQNVRMVDATGSPLSVGGGTQYVGDAAATATPTGTVFMGLANSAAPTDVSANNDAVALWANRSGSLNVVLRDGSNNAVATGVQYVEDSALAANAAQGTLVVARRTDSLSTLTPAADDAVGLRVSSRGALWTAIDSPTATPSANFTNVAGIVAVGENMVFDGSTWDRQSAADRYITASSTPTVGIGASLAPDRRYTSQALGTVIGNTQQWDTNGADVVIVHVATTQTGTFTFEVSADGSNWVAAEARDMALDLWVSGTNLTPTANKVYRIITNGWRLMRARTVSTLNGTVALTATLAAHSTVLNAIDTGPAPHAIGYSVATATAQYTTTQSTAATIGPTVASTQRLVVTYFQIQAGGTTPGTVQVFFTTGTTYSRGTQKAIFDGEFAPSASLKPGFAMACPPGGWVGAADEELKIIDSAAINPLTITIWYYLIPA